jgi:hypothetical protein
MVHGGAASKVSHAIVDEIDRRYDEQLAAGTI